MTSLLPKSSMRSLISFNQIAEILGKEASYEPGYKSSSGSARRRSGSHCCLARKGSEDQRVPLDCRPRIAQWPGSFEMFDVGCRSLSTTQRGERLRWGEHGIGRRERNNATGAEEAGWPGDSADEWRARVRVKRTISTRL